MPYRRNKLFWVFVRQDFYLLIFFFVKEIFLKRERKNQYNQNEEKQGDVGGFFLQRKGTEEENGKGTEGEKTECKDWSVEWDEDGGITFFVLRAPARCTKRVSI